MVLTNNQTNRLRLNIYSVSCSFSHVFICLLVDIFSIDRLFEGQLRCAKIGIKSVLLIVNNRIRTSKSWKNGAHSQSVLQNTHTRVLMFLLHCVTYCWIVFLFGQSEETSCGNPLVIKGQIYGLSQVERNKTWIISRAREPS